MCLNDINSIDQNLLGRSSYSTLLDPDLQFLSRVFCYPCILWKTTPLVSWLLHKAFLPGSGFITGSRPSLRFCAITTKRNSYTYVPTNRTSTKQEIARYSSSAWPFISRPVSQKNSILQMCAPMLTWQSRIVRQSLQGLAIDCQKSGRILQATRSCSRVLFQVLL